MRIIAFVTHPAAIRDILIHLGLPHRPPRVAPARAPPQATLGLDPTPAFDPAKPEPIPEYVFDPSHPDELGDGRSPIRLRPFDALKLALERSLSRSARSGIARSGMAMDTP